MGSLAAGQGFLILNSIGDLVPFKSGVADNYSGAESVTLLGELCEGRKATTLAVPPNLHWTEPDLAAGRGFVRITPIGTVVARLLREWRESAARRVLLGEEISTPSVFRWGSGNTALADLTKAFADRLFALDGRGAILRYGADPGYFSYLQSLSLSEHHLPLRHRETGMVFRRSQNGELRGVARLHEYDMLEHHTLCASPSQALGEYQRQFMAQLELHRAWTDATVAWFRVTADTLPTAMAVLRSALAPRVPVMVEVLPDMPHYWSLTHTLYTRGRLKTFNSQIDPVNPQRFAIRVRGATGPLAVVHTSLASTERLMLVAADEAMRRPVAELPLWLAPIQLRFLPVAQRHMSTASAAVDAATDAGVRADIDDRHRSVGKRVRDAAAEWIPFVVVVGDATRNGEPLRVRHRDGATVDMTIDEVVQRIVDASEGWPKGHLGHRLVSCRTPNAR
ncbi:MAG: His/Gly/Thr/Pro-type tRNA ligase C-terminal domain-containing protein [Mycobacteriales bacterium]